MGDVLVPVHFGQRNNEMTTKPNKMFVGFAAKAVKLVTALEY